MVKRLNLRAAFAAVLMGGTFGLAWGGTLTDADGNVWTSSGGTITAVTIETTTMTIPDEIDGTAITAFNAAVFKGNARAVRVTIPATVTAIPAQAFQGCANLKEVTVLGEGLKSIGKNAFQNCPNLAAFTIPNSVTTLGQGVFSGCSALEEVTIGDGVTTLTGVEYDDGYNGTYRDYTDSTELWGNHANALFYNCTSLKTINWGANVAEIGNIAFLGCTALEEIDIPDSVTEIGNHAFLGCSALMRVKIGKDVKKVGRMAFRHLTNLTNVTFGESVESIGVMAFQDCVNLKNFTLPAKIQYLRYRCFAGCNKALTEVTIPTNVDELDTVLGQGVFSGCTKLETVTFGDTLKTLTGVEYDDGYNGTYRDYTDSTELWGNHANALFYNCTSLKTINWGADIRTIGNIAFLGCTALEEVDIPDTVTSLGNHAFLWCSNLQKVTIGDNVPAIGRMAFRGLSNLTSVTFGSSVTTIEQQAFQDCVNLHNFTLPAKIQYLRHRCFAGCNKALTAVTIPTNSNDLETVLGQGVFSGCTKLETVTFGDTLKKLTGVDYADGYNGTYRDYTDSTELWGNYGNALFYNCTSLKTINWGAGVKTIGDIAFLGCTALETVTLPANVSAIGKHAFYGCSALRTVEVKGSVTSIGRRAFANCANLRYVDFQGPVMAFDAGEEIFAFDKDVVIAYAAEGSTGWTGVADVGGLPASGTWCGARVMYGPADKKLANPYDFYPYTPTGIKINRTNYDWPGALMLTKTPYLHGSTIPATVAEFKQGEPVYLNYAFDEYWRGSLFENMAITFALSGTKAASENVTKSVSRLDYPYCWGTNVALNILKDLAPGNYTLTMTLNTGKGLAETDDENNTAALAFKVLARASYTVAFDAHGGTPAPTGRTVYEDAEVGELPTVTRTGYAFNGWYTAESQGTPVSSATKVTADVTYHAQWTKLPNIIFWKPTDMTWTEPLFVASSQSANSMQTSFTEGDSVYLFYACYEADGKILNTNFKNTFVLKDATGAAVKSFYQPINGIYSGTCKGVFGEKTPSLQGLKPGKYTLMCELDSENAVREFDESDNVRSVTFTIVAKGSPVPVDPPVNPPVNPPSEPTPAQPSVPVDPMTVDVPVVQPTGAFTAPQATTQSGVLMQDGAAVGVLQVKVGKESKGGSKVSVTVIGLDGKKYTSKAVKVPTGGTTTQTFEVKKLGTLTLTLGANGYAGSLDGLKVTSVDGAGATEIGVATFVATDLSALPGALTAYLPTDEVVSRTAKKWKVVAKAGKLKYNKKANPKRGVVEGLQATGANVAGLKLTYAPKTQTFKGSFKVWTFDEAKKKLKSVSAKVTGVVVNGNGYGVAMVKKDVIGELTVK